MGGVELSGWKSDVIVFGQSIHTLTVFFNTCFQSLISTYIFISKMTVITSSKSAKQYNHSVRSKAATLKILNSIC